MTSLEEASNQSPWISVWLRPRKTIEHVLAGQPQRFVWLLGSIGTMSGFAIQLLGFTVGVLYWRMWVALTLAVLIWGLIVFYIMAFVLRWTGRLFGGLASTADLRSMLAWSGLPGILGLCVGLTIIILSLSIGAAIASPRRLSLLMQLIALLVSWWSVILSMLMFARIQRFGFWRTVGAYSLGAILSMVLYLFLAFAIRTLLFQPFSIPARSMMPTLFEGDEILVSKYAYGYTHYSIPFSSQWFSGRIFGSEPAQGDVVVFRMPKDNVTDFVKRVVGLPGDRIQMKEGLLYINGVPVKRQQLADFVGDDPCGRDGNSNTKRWLEILPNGASYETLDCVDNGFYDNTNVYTVPPGQFFVLGDNRDNSTDSRVLTSIGYIPFENIIGRVGMIFYSTRHDATGAELGVRADRVGLLIR